MIDTTIRAYATRQAGMAFVAAVLAAAVAVVGHARPGVQTELSAQPSAGPAITGRARVIDGDSIEIGGTSIRLEGIDAPEMGQTCTTASGHPWPCGRVAARVLGELIGEQEVRCDSRGPDRYGRTLAVCRTGSVELNAELVRRGHAWAFVRYSQSYVREEARARAARVGIWVGHATPAWDFRAGRWADAEPSAPSGCAIKGNVTAGGLIYHMPWSPWYGKINMDLGKGKRWFCSEAEAVAAGWRPAQTR